MRYTEIIQEAPLSSKQAALLAALDAGATIVRDKSPPYRWENASDPLRPQIPKSTVDALLRSGKVELERIESRFLSHQLVMRTARLNEAQHGVMINPTSAALQTLTRTKTLRLLWTPTRLYVWDALLNDHKGMAKQLGLAGNALRFVLVKTTLVVRSYDLDDQPVTDQQIQVALTSSTMRFFKNAIDQHVMTLEVG